jgi:hypothetical protein
MKEKLRRLLKEASDFKITKRNGEITNIELDPEYQSELEHFREAVGTGIGAGIGGGIAHLATDKLADDPLTAGVGTVLGGVAGGGLGFAAAKKTNPRTIEKLKEKIKAKK